MRKVPKVIDEKTFNKLIKNMTKKYKLACKLMFYAGLRVSEVCRLRKRDIDLKRMLIFIERSKYLRNRYVPIDEKNLLYDLIEFMKGKKDDDFIINTKPNLLWYNIKYHAKKIGLGDIHPHTLRHSFATRLLERGFTIIEVQQLLGHSNVATTQVYLHTSFTSIREKWKKIVG